jgi:uncharacterized RDD family membrane protein YckC
MITELPIKVRRFLALFVDVFYVIGIGALVGLILKPWLVNLGPKAASVGFCAALLYHGLCNSLVLQGQTPGKYFLHLKVVTDSGRSVGPIRSLLRSILVVCLFFSSPPVFPALSSAPIEYILGILALALIYLSFVGPSGRSVHDFIFGTYVVDSDRKEIDRCDFPYKHLAGIGVIFIMIEIFTRLPFIYPQVDPQWAQNLTTTHAEIVSWNSVLDASIKLEGDKFTIAIQTNGPILEGDRLAARAACALVNSFQLRDSTQPIEVAIMRGFDMRIYHSWEVSMSTHSATEWCARYAKYPEYNLK